MRVAFFDDRFLEVYGAQENVLLLAEMAKANGHDVLFVTTAEGLLSNAARQRGLEVLVSNAPARLKVFEKGAIRGGLAKTLLTAKDTARYSFELHEELSAWNVEVLVAAAVRPALMMLRSRLAPNIKTVLFAQNSTPFGLFAAASLPGIDVLAPISSGALTTFPDWSVRFAKSQALLPSGRDLDRFSDDIQRNADERLRIVSVGSLTERKGFHVLLDVIASMKDDYEISLDIVGGPSSGPDSQAYASMLEDRVRSEGLPVTLHGWQDEVVPYFRAANVFALASENEGLPGVIIEAMACGLPIVTTDAGGCRDAVIEAESGYVVPVSYTHLTLPTNREV